MDFFDIENPDGACTFSFFGGDPLANFVAQVHAQITPAVPTVSQWGSIVIVLLILTGGTIVLRRCRVAAAQ